MRALAIAAAVLLLRASAANAIPHTPWPISDQPVWLSNDLIRFQSNIQTRDWKGSAYVVAPDGSGLRPATVDEANEAPAAPAPGETVEVELQAGWQNNRELVILGAAGGRRVLQQGAIRDAALSPDGKTVVFSMNLGWGYSDGTTLYAAPVDGSTQPVRLTPTPCTFRPAIGIVVGSRCIDGTDGADDLVGTKRGDIIIGGSGGDTIRAGDGENVVQSQWGNDDIRTGSGPDAVDAGDGADVIRTGAGPDAINPGRGRDIVFAGRGGDYVYANDGERDTIDCGPGDDRVRADRIDVLHHCEHVTYALPDPGPSPSPP